MGINRRNSSPNELEPDNALGLSLGLPSGGCDGASNEVLLDGKTPCRGDGIVLNQDEWSSDNEELRSALELSLGLPEAVMTVKTKTCSTARHRALTTVLRYAKTRDHLSVRNWAAHLGSCWSCWKAAMTIQMRSCWTACHRAETMASCLLKIRDHMLAVLGYDDESTW